MNPVRFSFFSFVRDLPVSASCVGTMVGQSVLPVPGEDLALPWYAQARDGAGHSLTRRTPLSGAQQSGGTAHTELKTRAARDSRQPSASVRHQSIGPSSGVPLCKAHTVERPEQMPEQRTRQRKTDELPLARSPEGPLRASPDGRLVERRR